MLAAAPTNLLHRPWSTRAGHARALPKPPRRPLGHSRIARHGAPLLAALLGGCAGPQSALEPHGPAAAGIAHLWWVMAIGAAAVLLLVMAILLFALLRPHAARAPVRWLIPVGGVAFPTVVLAALLVYGTGVGEQGRPLDDGTLRIEVIGHQWWWEVRYPSLPGSASLVNELHMPAGQPVDIVLGSADVIHSFWVPGLAGKLDAIPGRSNVLRLSAFAPGEFRGQCAEFCGALHSHMVLRVVAHAPEQFTAWLRALQRGDGPAPTAAPARPAQPAASGVVDAALPPGTTP